jgi:tRNA modification GTPase
MLDASTIAAIATPPGAGGIGVIRISGPDAAGIARHIFRLPSGRAPKLSPERSHRLIFGTIVDPATGATIDEVLLGWMAAPNTFTREDTVEISCHGGPTPLRETLRVALAAGARPAEPGEFTLRAFLNGRLDLTQAEAVLQVISARTSDGLTLAVDELGGSLAKRIAPARAAVLSLLAWLDAAADFPEDEIPPVNLDAELALAESTVAEIVAGSQRGMLYQHGARVALVGKPNVGKSSLLNALLRVERAIVTPIAGTTRDLIAETATIGGVPVTLLDTAGIAETVDLVEQLGIERSRDALSTAAAVVLVLDGSQPPTNQDLAVARLVAARLPETGMGAVPPALIVINKRDLPERADQSPALDLLPGIPVVELSTRTGEGLDELESGLLAAISGEASANAAPALVTSRQRAALERALNHLREAIAAKESGAPHDLLAIDVRAAMRAIGEVTGESIDESVLTEIFSRFCIGK